MDSQLKISRAVTNLAFSNPFFGSCLMQLKLQENIATRTMATDGVNLYWGDNFVKQMTEEHTRGVLCHEVMHVVLKHCVPWPGKDKQLCNVAMDWVINEQLRDANISLPEGALYDPTGVTRGWAWQEVYNFLKNTQEDKEDVFEGTPNKDSKGDLNQENRNKIKEQIANAEDHFDTNEDDSPAELEERASRIDDMLVRAANAQEAAGRGQMPGCARDRINEIRTPQIDWREELINTVRSRYPEDYSFAKPNRKFLGSGLYLPSMSGFRAGTIVVGFDTSGSMSKEDLSIAVSEINFIINDIKPEKVILMSADYSIANVREYTADTWFTLEDFEAVGGGGTSFRPVFEEVEKLDSVDQVIYFSDMYVNDHCFPRKSPDYPVTFVSTTGNDYPVPFGKLIKIRR